MKFSTQEEYIVTMLNLFQHLKLKQETLKQVQGKVL
jgi:hypothetical protein